MAIENYVKAHDEQSNKLINISGKYYNIGNQNNKVLEVFSRGSIPACEGVAKTNSSITSMNMQSVADVTVASSPPPYRIAGSGTIQSSGKDAYMQVMTIELTSTPSTSIDLTRDYQIPYVGSSSSIPLYTEVFNAGGDYLIKGSGNFVSGASYQNLYSIQISQTGTISGSSYTSYNCGKNLYLKNVINNGSDYYYIGYFLTTGGLKNGFVMHVSSSATTYFEYSNSTNNLEFISGCFDASGNINLVGNTYGGSSSSVCVVKMSSSCSVSSAKTYGSGLSAVGIKTVTTSGGNDFVVVANKTFVNTDYSNEKDIVAFRDRLGSTPPVVYWNKRYALVHTDETANDILLNGNCQGIITGKTVNSSAYGSSINILFDYTTGNSSCNSLNYDLSATAITVSGSSGTAITPVSTSISPSPTDQHSAFTGSYSGTGFSQTSMCCSFSGETYSGTSPECYGAHTTFSISGSASAVAWYVDGVEHSRSSTMLSDLAPSYNGATGLTHTYKISALVTDGTCYEFIPEHDFYVNFISFHPLASELCGTSYSTFITDQYGTTGCSTCWTMSTDGGTATALSGINPATSVLTGSPGHLYKVFYTQGGCTATQTYDLRLPSFSPAGACTGSGITHFTYNGANTDVAEYRWSYSICNTCGTSCTGCSSACCIPFGGNTPTPTFPFHALGTYYIKLEIVTSGGCVLSNINTTTSTFPAFVYSSPPLVPDLTVTMAGSDATLTTSVDLTAGVATLDYGLGTTPFAMTSGSITHTYPSTGGPYKALLTYTINGCSTSTYAWICTATKASFTGPTTACSSGTLNYTFANTSAAKYTQWLVDGIPIGPPLIICSLTTCRDLITTLAPGKHRITLIANDDCVQETDFTSDQSFIDVSVDLPPAPVIIFKKTSTGVQLSVGGTYPSGSSFVWSVDGATYSGSVINITGLGYGTHDVTLTVTKDGYCGTIPVVVTKQCVSDPSNGVDCCNCSPPSAPPLPPTD